MQVWIVRHDRKMYWITSEPPRRGTGGRFIFNPHKAGFHTLLPAEQAEELLGFQLDLGGCIRRELLLFEPAAADGTGGEANHGGDRP